MKRVADIIRPGLDILFCGINPGLLTAATSHHFARPGNRFWPTLHRAGLTPRLFSPHEQSGLLDLGIGITNFVERPSAAADELSTDEIRAGTHVLVEKVRRLKPRTLAILGVGAYRIGFNAKTATIGRQKEKIGRTIIWVLPNPSGLNAHYRLEDLARLFAELPHAKSAAARRLDAKAIARRDADESRVR